MVHKYNMKMRLANLNKTAAMENTGITKEASMKYAPFVNEICDRIGIL